MMRVTARAIRKGAWWAIEVVELQGVYTQARRLDQVSAMVADAVSLIADVPADDVDVTVVPSTEFDDVIAQARLARQEADEAASRASETARRAVRALTDINLTVRDVGMLMGVSPQRVSQLLNSEPAPDRGVLKAR